MGRNSDNLRQTISGLLRDYGERAKIAAVEALRENGETVAAEAKRRCPVDTGRLRDSIHVEKVSNSKVRVVADARDENGYPYGAVIEYGSNGKPFLRPALRAVKESLKQHTIEKIREAVEAR